MNEQLKKMIKSLNLTNTEAAKKLGITEDKLDKILKNVEKIDVEDLEKYAKKLGIDPKDILKNVDVSKTAEKLAKGDLGGLAKGLLKK